MPVPKSIGPMLWLNQALPFRARAALAHLTKADEILSHVDAAERAAYVERVKASETSGTVIPVELDVCDPVSVRKAVEAVAEVAPDGLDVLINNAGYALTGPAETIATDDVRAQFETNVIGLFDVALRPG